MLSILAKAAVPLTLGVALLAAGRPAGYGWALVLLGLALLSVRTGRRRIAYSASSAPRDRA